jgi:ElaA protein
MNTLWQYKKFSQLSLDELYDIIKLRIDVFVVEQTCYYHELDNKDRAHNTLHLFSYRQQQLAAYLRILPQGVEYDDYCAIGRVVVAPLYRGQQLGHQLMQHALMYCQQNLPEQSIKISAQAHLQTFYQQHGFETVSDIYLEDNIPHVAMIKRV